MTVDNVTQQLLSAARRGGLVELFPDLEFDADDIEGLESAVEGEALAIRFGNADGPIGVLFVDVCDSGNPEDDGLTVGLRGWNLNDDVASV